MVTGTHMTWQCTTHIFTLGSCSSEALSITIEYRNANMKMFRVDALQYTRDTFLETLTIVYVHLEAVGF